MGFYSRISGCSGSLEGVIEGIIDSDAKSEFHHG